MIKLLVSVLFVSALLFGAWKMGDYALWERRTGTASLAWPSVEGSVVRTGFVTSGQGVRRSTSVDILYRYQVDGSEYEHNRIRFGAHGSGNGAGRWGKLGRLAKGAPLTVFYDPQDPQQATLEVGPTGRSLGLLAAAGVLASFGGFLVWVGYAASARTANHVRTDATSSV